MASYRRRLTVTLNNIAMLKKKKVTSVVSNDYILWIQADSTAGYARWYLSGGQTLEQKSFPFVNLGMSHPFDQS